MDVIRKVREVGQNYELNSYKTFSQNVQLDAKLTLEKYHKARIIIHRLEQQNQKLALDLKRTEATLNEKAKRLLMTEALFHQMLQQFKRKLQHNIQDRKFKNQSTQATDHSAATQTALDELKVVKNVAGPVSGPPKQKYKLFLVDKEQLEQLRLHNKALGPIRLLDDGLRLLDSKSRRMSHGGHPKKILVHYDLPTNIDSDRPIPVGWSSKSGVGQNLFVSTSNSK